MKNVSYYRHLHPESLKKLVAITKITAVSLLTVLPSTMQAEPTYSQSVVISIKTERMLLTDLFSQIEKQSEFLFFYVDKDVADIKVNIKANSNQIDEILTQALTGTGLTYTINDRNINIMRKAYARQQQAKQITGKVLDNNGDPIIGANVVEKGTTNGSITDVEGLFNISIAPGAILSISYIGYKPTEIKVGSQNSYNIIRYGTQNRPDRIDLFFGRRQTSDEEYTAAFQSITRTDGRRTDHTFQRRPVSRSYYPRTWCHDHVN